MSVHSIGRIGAYQVGQVQGPSGSVQRPRPQEAVPLTGSQAPQVRTDQLQLSAAGLAANRLLRLWGAVSYLFGDGGAQGVPSAGGWPVFQPPDLSGLRQALQQAALNAAEMQTRKQVVDTLKTSALAQAEKLVAEYYGLQGDGAPVQVVLHDELDGALASVSFQYDQRGRMVNSHLHLGMNQFRPDAGPNGVNDHVIQNDRIIAHELTHLVMGRTLDMAALPDWFAEGTAEYIAGGAERVGLMLRTYTPEGLMRRLDQPWEGDSSQYAAAYAAVRLLNEATQENGGLKAVMAQLKEGRSLSDSIAAVSGGRFAGEGEFLRAIALEGNGAAFIRQIDVSGRDAGSIKPGPGRAVVADWGVRTEQPLQGFRVQWPSLMDGFRLLPAAAWGFTPARAASAAYLRQMPEGQK